MQKKIHIIVKPIYSSLHLESKILNYIMYTSNINNILEKYGVLESNCREECFGFTMVISIFHGFMGIKCFLDIRLYILYGYNCI